MLVKWSERNERNPISLSEKLSEKGVNCLYHFTDKNNLDNIKKKGLCPRNELKEDEFIAGGNEWSVTADDNCGLDAFVHLCLFRNHPMKYQREREGKEFVWLKINLDVLDFPGVKYTNGVSNKSGVQLLSEEDAISCYDFEAMGRIDFDIDGNQQRKSMVEKYEILVPSVIPWDMIRIS